MPDEPKDLPPDLDDPELAKQAEVTDEDLDDAAEFWREMAPEGWAGLMGANQAED